MALLFLKEIFVMIPSSLGISSQESASSTPSDDTEVSRTPTTPQQPTSPRMVQRSPEAEQDGMEVDNPEDEKGRIQDHRRPPKRSREYNESEHVTHSEPKLKRQRRSVDASPVPSEPNQQPASSSSSSSSSASSTSSFPSISSSSLTHATVTASSTMSASAGPAKLICNALGANDALEVVTFFGPDQEKATALFFGETVIEWPDGYSLLQVGPPSPALAELLTECGVQVLWQGLTQRE
ncbi:MAG: hypothetical protein ACKO6R_00580 [Burkholderiaceae bacterium]